MTDETTANGGRRRAEIEAWWALIVRVLSFIFGTQLVTYAAAFMMGDPVELRLLLATGGFAMMGPVIAASMATIIRAGRGASNG